VASDLTLPAELCKVLELSVPRAEELTHLTAHILPLPPRKRPKPVAETGVVLVYAEALPACVQSFLFPSASDRSVLRGQADSRALHSHPVDQYWSEAISLGLGQTSTWSCAVSSYLAGLCLSLLSTSGH
jgi:hypothetical protein